ncbi:hypothetical protein S7711_00247 [Stachybotrys chartarum IBT 7711]|uniref:Chitin-binding type-4 domain-containing protein n=1 Tax=Stachybotrys chartarum (strain CBS 109288 / IBT 7711) TaxID=1280523 RepID=A0A084B3W9_STACB|nr:hypothetical protein S7711_00247 [Stachybotrys chartarum IBT 7711]
MDCHSDEASTTICAKVLKGKGARLASLFFVNDFVRAVNPKLEHFVPMGYSVLGDPYVIAGYWTSNPRDYEMFETFVPLYWDLLAQGKLKPPKLYVNRGGSGLEGVINGLEELKQGNTGSAHQAACGAAVTRRLESDRAGPIENAMAYVDGDYNCNAFLCRGYQFADNSGNVQTYQAGDVVDFYIDLIAGHRPGYANISVVDLAANRIIGQPLKTWTDWLSRDPTVPDDEQNFNVTIPANLGSVCDVGGKCAIQWYWYATGNRQTYISCLDFVIEE